MTITLRPISPENWVTCINLTPTPEQQQQHFVAPNVLSLAQCYAGELVEHPARRDRVVVML